MYTPISREDLLIQGHCCDNNCTNCPYCENGMTPSKYFEQKYALAYLSNEEHKAWMLKDTDHAVRYMKEMVIQSGGGKTFQYAEWWRCEKFENGKWNDGMNGADGWDSNNHPQEIKKISGDPRKEKTYGLTHSFKDLVMHNFERNIKENWRVNLVVVYKDKITLCLSYDFGDPVFVNNVKQKRTKGSCSGNWYNKALRYDKEQLKNGGKRTSGGLSISRKDIENLPSLRLDYFDREVYEESSHLFLTGNGRPSRTSRFIEGLARNAKILV